MISQDGKYILTARDQNARMISGTGTMLWDQWLEVPVTDMSMTPNASLILAGGANRLRLISPSGEGIRHNVTMPVMSHFRLFPDGEQMVITSTKGIHTSNLTFFSEWTDANVTQDLVEVAADGSSFVSVTNNRIRFYTRDGQLRWERALPGGNALGFAYSRDGSTIVVGRDDNTLSVLDRDGNLLWTAPAAYWVTSVAVSDDGNTIVAGSMDKTISVYDRAGTKLGFATAKNQIKSGSVAVSGDGSVIAAVDGSSRIRFLPVAVHAAGNSPHANPITCNNNTGSFHNAGNARVYCRYDSGHDPEGSPPPCRTFRGTRPLPCLALPEILNPFFSLLPSGMHRIPWDFPARK